MGELSGYPLMETANRIAFEAHKDQFRRDGKTPYYKHPHAVAEALAAEGIYAWDGNYYALAVTQRLEVEAGGGMVRVGAVHYNTLEEVAQLGEVLKKI